MCTGNLLAVHSFIPSFTHLSTPNQHSSGQALFRLRRWRKQTGAERGVRGRGAILLTLQDLGGKSGSDSLAVIPYRAPGRASPPRGSLPPQPVLTGWQWSPPPSSPMKSLSGSSTLVLVVWAFVPIPPPPAVLWCIWEQGPGQGLRGDYRSPPAKERKRKDQTFEALGCWLGASWLKGPRLIPLRLCLQCPPGPSGELWEATGPWHGGPSLEGLCCWLWACECLGSVGGPQAVTPAHGLCSHSHRLP